MHNMRSYLLASIVAFALPACTQDITGTSGGGDDMQPACGNGVVDPGETCDDANTASGDGCSATCQTEASATPKIAGSMNPVSLELYNPFTANLMLTAQGGFTGTANLAASLVDGTGTAISGATVTVAATADLSSGSATVPITIMLPLATTGSAIAGTLKVDVTSTVDPVTVSAAADIQPILTIAYTAGTGTTANAHDLHSMTFTVVRGTIVRVQNNDTVEHRTHADGGFVHEPVGGGQPNGHYDLPTTGIAPGQGGSIGCHDHPTITSGNDEYMTFTVM